MPLGKIYKITCSENNLTYIGSTFNYLKQRLSEHKSDYKRYLDGKRNYVSSFEIVKYESAKIELIKEVEVQNPAELKTIEGTYIKQYKKDDKLNCTNMLIAGRTGKEYKEDNKDKIKEYQKEYYIDNLDKIKKHKNQKHSCEICKGKYTTSHKAQHIKSIKHQKAILEQQQPKKIINITIKNIENLTINNNQVKSVKDMDLYG